MTRQRKPTPVVAWSMTYADGTINPHYLMPTKRQVLASFQSPGMDWEKWRKAGHRPVKVVIVTLDDWYRLNDGRTPPRASDAAGDGGV